MGQIFKGQIGLEITATVGENVTGATCKIKCLDPDNNPSEFDADIITAETGVIRYITTKATDLPKKGEWTFWGHVTFANGNTAAGEPFKRYIYEEGQTLVN